MILQDYLKSIGKNTFVKFFEEFYNLHTSTEELHDLLSSYTLNSKRTKISKARSVIKKGYAKEALENITKSKKVDSITKKQAFYLLTKYFS